LVQVVDVNNSEHSIPEMWWICDAMCLHRCLLHTSHTI